MYRHLPENRGNAQRRTCWCCKKSQRVNTLYLCEKGHLICYADLINVCTQRRVLNPPCPMANCNAQFSKFHQAEVEEKVRRILSGLVYHQTFHKVWPMATLNEIASRSMATNQRQQSASSYPTANGQKNKLIDCIIADYGIQLGNLYKLSYDWAELANNRRTKANGRGSKNMRDATANGPKN